MVTLEAPRSRFGVFLPEEKKGVLTSLCQAVRLKLGPGALADSATKLERELQQTEPVRLNLTM